MALRRSDKAKAQRRPAAKPRPSRFGEKPLLMVGVVIGFVGLAALAATVLGSRRLREEYVRPLSDAALVPFAAVAPQADRVWAETRPWRDHVANILTSINTRDVREAIAARLAQWAQKLG